IASTEYPALKELRRMQASYFFDDPVQRSLANAVERGNIDQARVAIENGAEVNAVGKEGMVPLFWALTKQNIDGFRFLLEQGADPRSEEHTSELQSRFELVCRLLLEKKKEIS